MRVWLRNLKCFLLHSRGVWRDEGMGRAFWWCEEPSCMSVRSRPTTPEAP